jgi:integrase
LPVEWYAKLLAGLEASRDRAIFLIASFCALRPSEVFGLTWGSYQGLIFKIMNTAWRGQFQAKKIKRKNRFGRSNYRLVAIPEAIQRSVEEWRRECANTEENTLMFPAIPRGRKPLDKPMHPDNWLRLRLYPVAKALGLSFHPTVQVEAQLFHPRQAGSTPDRDAGATGHSDIRSTLKIYTQTLDAEVLHMANDMTNRLLQLGKEAESGSIQ